MPLIVMGDNGTYRGQVQIYGEYYKDKISCFQISDLQLFKPFCFGIGLD